MHLLIAGTDFRTFKNKYRGNIFYFCSPGCKKKFDENPEKYLKKG